jgi:hypothetical protein
MIGVPALGGGLRRRCTRPGPMPFHMDSGVWAVILDPAFIAQLFVFLVLEAVVNQGRCLPQSSRTESLWSPRRLGPASHASGATFGCARPQTAASRARRAGREPADLPQAGVVADVKPALSVASAQRNQLIDELTCEE